ncbi:hypothetical protein DNTS_004285 [Danionella cerebrum]|uniref:Uncharacterized protein n=1 Tax=Danionella cerebrum TaxID=2873325 RepID=A0A553RI54_9TELE|nr:hypothetical protein DNTS_004285 [Danionella translucida]
MPLSNSVPTRDKSSRAAGVNERGASEPERERARERRRRGFVVGEECGNAPALCQTALKGVKAHSASVGKRGGDRAHTHSRSLARSQTHTPPLLLLGFGVICFAAVGDGVERTHYPATCVARGEALMRLETLGKFLKFMNDATLLAEQS